jgi:hypothetical protein
MNRSRDETGRHAVLRTPCLKWRPSSSLGEIIGFSKVVLETGLQSLGTKEA